MKASFAHYRADYEGKDTCGPSHLMWLYQLALARCQVGLHRKTKQYPQLKAAVVCTLTDEDAVPVSQGFSFCSALDNFVTKTGRRIALGRAQKALEEAHA